MDEVKDFNEAEIRLSPLHLLRCAAIGDNRPNDSRGFHTRSADHNPALTCRKWCPVIARVTARPSRFGRRSSVPAMSDQ